MIILYTKYIHQRKYLDPILDTILKNLKYSPYFNDRIGVLDKTYIIIYTLVKKRKPYQNQKGYFSQNLLVVCDFGIKSIYKLVE